jgi:hypothetical protein
VRGRVEAARRRQVERAAAGGPKLNDEQLWPGEAGEAPLVGTVGAAGGEPGQGAGGRHEEHRVAAPRGRGLGEVALSDAARPDEEDVLVALDETAGGRSRRVRCRAECQVKSAPK